MSQTHKTQQSPRYFSDAEQVVDEIVATVGQHIILGIPLGIGKPNPLVNAIYRRVVASPELRLTILTALSLEKPHASSDLEERFLAPVVERVFGDYPDLDYVKARRAQQLPSNVRVIEFFVKTGDYLQNDLAQQDYICSNYTNAARDMLAQNVNVLAQAVACKAGENGAPDRLSLSSNPDTTLDMLDILSKQTDRKVLTIACYNQKLPFMENQAAVAPELFDWILTDRASTHDLFAPPNMKVSLADYAIGLYASSLVKDGGTLQIGIGSLGDAIAHGLIMRDQNNGEYRQLLEELHGTAHGGQFHPQADLSRFQQGLYGCSEMFVNGFMHLIRHGIVRRQVVEDVPLQRLLNSGTLQWQLAPNTLQVLQSAGVVGQSLSAQEFSHLQHFGIFKENVRWEDGEIVSGELRFSATQLDLQQLAEHCLGTALQQGIFMHGGFFLGPRDFYSALHNLSAETNKKIGMSRISYINSICGHEELARLQRRDARFINTTMMVSLLGAASSDSLESGRVVSGVGGQYNFVAMADALPDARSILMLRSCHSRHDKTWSNIVWNYGQTTIPRHLRDIVITEYGIADLRGLTDSQCVERMLSITDSRFQDDLIKAAQHNGKLRSDYVLPAAYTNNTQEALAAKLRPWRERGLLPDFPFGTDFTEDEINIVKALKKLKASVGHPLELLKVIFKNLGDDSESTERYLERMHLDELDGLKMRLMRRLFVGNLS